MFEILEWIVEKIRQKYCRHTYINSCKENFCLLRHEANHKDFYECTKCGKFIQK